MSRDLRNTILIGDTRQRLNELTPQSVDCVITSPPYFQLRNYRQPQQIGLEENVDDWVTCLRDVLRDVARTLKPTGSVWLNLGDTHSSHSREGAPPKSLLLGPERLGLALIEDGWVIRNKIVWAKTNPMPSSIRDRLACTWEVIYFLTRSPRYFFDLDAIRMPHTSPAPRARRSIAVYPPRGHGVPGWASEHEGGNKGLAALRSRGMAGHPLGKNPGDVWTMSTAAFRGAHFATFPKQLIERPLLAGCPERVCAGCGRPWERRTERTLGQLAVRGELTPICGCDRGWRPGLVLDPFIGSGTVALVAIEHQRDWVGIELNPDFAAIAQARIDEAVQDGDELERAA